MQNLHGKTWKDHFYMSYGIKIEKVIKEDTAGGEESGFCENYSNPLRNFSSTYFCQ